MYRVAIYFKSFRRTICDFVCPYQSFHGKQMQIIINSLPASKHCTTGLSVPPGLNLSFHPFFRQAKTPKGDDSKEKLISSTLIWNRIRLRTLLLFVGFQLLVAGKYISLIATLLISHTTPAVYNCLV